MSKLSSTVTEAFDQ